MNVALILAGGIGVRMNKPLPKQFIEINKKPLIIHTLERFERNSRIDSIIVVCLESYINYFEQLCNYYSISKVKWIVSGGSTRHLSIICGLNALKDTIGADSGIVIHNANMPLVSQENIDSILCMLENGYDIVTTLASCSGYFYSKNSDDTLSLGPDRKTIFAAKVPEALKYSEAIKLYSMPMFEDKIYESYTAGMLGIIAGKKVGYCECSSTNFKITTDDEMALMEILLKNNDGK